MPWEGPYIIVEVLRPNTYKLKTDDGRAITNADVIRAFLLGTTYESLVHKLGHKGPRTTKELLNIATSHTSSEEAVGAIFDRSRSKAKRNEDANKGPSNRSHKKKNKKRHEGSLVAATEWKVSRAPPEGTLDHFDKLLEGPCLNHVGPLT